MQFLVPILLLGLAWILPDESKTETKPNEVNEDANLSETGGTDHGGDGRGVSGATDSLGRDRSVTGETNETQQTEQIQSPEPAAETGKETEEQ